MPIRLIISANGFVQLFSDSYFSCVFNQLKSNPEIYDGYVPMEYDDYLDKMSK